jgi:CorA-like Mg2+ transporter protein
MTIVSVVGIPPTVVAGIYGMNFKFMPELQRPAYLTYFVMIRSIFVGGFSITPMVRGPMLLATGIGAAKSEMPVIAMFVASALIAGSAWSWAPRRRSHERLQTSPGGKSRGMQLRVRRHTVEQTMNIGCHRLYL